jgi:membrane protein DedA with SNARE-associated domain
MDIGALTQTYGYPIVVLGTMLQGEAVLLIFGFMAHQGYLSVWAVAALAALAAVAGDTTYFGLGQVYGERFLRLLPAGLQAPVHWARRLVDRHPNKVLLIMRFFFGTRIVLPVVCGMSNIRITKFLAFNIPTACLWSSIFVGAGFLFGVAADAVIKQLEHFELWLVGLLAVLALTYHWIASRLQAGNNEQNGPKSA